MVASAWGATPANDEVASAVELAWRLRWSAPEVTLLTGERARRLATEEGDHFGRLSAESLALFALNRLGHGVSVVERGIAALREVEAERLVELAAPLRVELAHSARIVGAPLIAFGLLRPVLENQRLAAGVRAGGLLELAECLPGGSRDEGWSQALSEAERLYRDDDAFTPDDLLPRQALIQSLRAGFHRRRGESSHAERCVLAGLDLLASVRGRATDSGQVYARLMLERVHLLLDEGRPDRALEVAGPALEQPSRAASASALGWLRVVLATRLHLPAGRPDTARELLSVAVDDARRHNLDPLLSESLQALSYLYEAIDELPEALRCLRAAHVTEQRRQRSVHAARLQLGAEFSSSMGDAAALNATLARLLAAPGDGGRLAEISAGTPRAPVVFTDPGSGPSDLADNEAARPPASWQIVGSNHGAVGRQGHGFAGDDVAISDAEPDDTEAASDDLGRPSGAREVAEAMATESAAAESDPDATVGTTVSRSGRRAAPDSLDVSEGATGHDDAEDGARRDGSWSAATLLAGDGSRRHTSGRRAADSDSEDDPESAELGEPLIPSDPQSVQASHRAYRAPAVSGEEPASPTPAWRVGPDLPPGLADTKSVDTGSTDTEPIDAGPAGTGAVYPPIEQKTAPDAADGDHPVSESPAAPQKWRIDPSHQVPRYAGWAAVADDTESGPTDVRTEPMQGSSPAEAPSTQTTGEPSGASSESAAFGTYRVSADPIPGPPSAEASEAGEPAQPAAPTLPWDIDPGESLVGSTAWRDLSGTANPPSASTFGVGDGQEDGLVAEAQAAPEPPVMPGATVLPGSVPAPAEGSAEAGHSAGSGAEVHDETSARFAQHDAAAGARSMAVPGTDRVAEFSSSGAMGSAPVEPSLTGPGVDPVAEADANEITAPIPVVSDDQGSPSSGSASAFGPDDLGSMSLDIDLAPTSLALFRGIGTTNPLLAYENEETSAPETDDEAADDPNPLSRLPFGMFGSADFPLPSTPTHSPQPGGTDPAVAGSSAPAVDGESGAADRSTVRQTQTEPDRPAEQAPMAANVAKVGPLPPDSFASEPQADGMQTNLVEETPLAAMEVEPAERLGGGESRSAGGDADSARPVRWAIGGAPDVPDHPGSPPPDHPFDAAAATDSARRASTAPPAMAAAEIAADRHETGYPSAAGTQGENDSVPGFEPAPASRPSHMAASRPEPATWEPDGSVESVEQTGYADAQAASGTLSAVAAGAAIPLPPTTSTAVPWQSTGPLWESADESPTEPIPRITAEPVASAPKETVEPTTPPLGMLLDPRASHAVAPVGTPRLVVDALRHPEEHPPPAAERTADQPAGEETTSTGRLRRVRSQVRIGDLLADAMVAYESSLRGLDLPAPTDGPDQPSQDPPAQRSAEPVDPGAPRTADGSSAGGGHTPPLPRAGRSSPRLAPQTPAPRADSEGDTPHPAVDRAPQASASQTMGVDWAIRASSLAHESTGAGDPGVDAGPHAENDSDSDRVWTPPGD